MARPTWCGRCLLFSYNVMPQLQTMYVPSDFQERSSLLGTVMKPGSNLFTVSSPMIANFGAESDAKV